MTLKKEKLDLEKEFLFHYKLLYGEKISLFLFLRSYIFLLEITGIATQHCDLKEIPTKNQ